MRARTHHRGFLGKYFYERNVRERRRENQTIGLLIRCDRGTFHRQKRWTIVASPDTKRSSRSSTQFCFHNVYNEIGGKNVRSGTLLAFGIFCLCVCMFESTKRIDSLTEQWRCVRIISALAVAIQFCVRGNDLLTWKMTKKVTYKCPSSSWMAKADLCSLCALYWALSVLSRSRQKKKKKIEKYRNKISHNGHGVCK